MVNVLFDYQHFSEQRYGGITRYFANIMQEIDNRTDVVYELSALYSRNYYIRDKALPMSHKLGDILFQKSLKKEIKWNRAYSRYVLQKGNYNVVHPTNYHPYFLRYIKAPFVLTVHDMIHEKFPASFKANDPVADYKREVIAKAYEIIVISEATKKDLIEILNVPESKINLIYHGVRIKPFPTEKVPRTLDIPQDFVLYVGDRNHYKNFNRFAEAFAKITADYPYLYLVCTGGFRFSKEEINFLTQIDIIHRCIRLDVTDDELTELYQHAHLFIFPSLCEGFGFPLLEAFQNCCPVACSNTSCFPEIAGDAALFFNPLDIEDITAKILKVLNDAKMKAALIARGKSRLAYFPIEKCMDETVAVYKKVALTAKS